MTVYLNIGRNGQIKITEQPLGVENIGGQFLSAEMPEGCTIEQVYWAVFILPQVTWRNHLLYVSEIDVEDGDEACDEAIDFRNQVEEVLRSLL